MKEPTDVPRVRDPQRRKKPQTLAEKKRAKKLRNLEAKRVKLEEQLLALAEKYQLYKETLRVNLVDNDRITINAQFRALHDHERLPGLPNSEEELEPDDA